MDKYLECMKDEEIQAFRNIDIFIAEVNAESIPGVVPTILVPEKLPMVVFNFGGLYRIYEYHHNLCDEQDVHVLFKQHIPDDLPFEVYVDISDFSDLYVCIKADTFSEDYKYSNVCMGIGKFEIVINHEKYIITHNGNLGNPPKNVHGANTGVHKCIKISKMIDIF